MSRLADLTQFWSDVRTLVEIRLLGIWSWCQNVAGPCQTRGIPALFTAGLTQHHECCDSDAVGDTMWVRRVLDPGAIEVPRTIAGAPARSPD